jgi:hypothetical protein
MVRLEDEFTAERKDSRVLSASHFANVAAVHAVVEPAELLADFRQKNGVGELSLAHAGRMV